MTLRTLARWLLTGLLLSSSARRQGRRSAGAADSTPTTPRRSASTRQSRSSSPSSSTTCLSSDTVPSPKKALGYVVGTPEKLTYTKDINAYFRALAAASPRVKVWTIGKSEEGREMLLAAVSSEENLGRIDRYKQITAKLADPRKTTDAEAADLVREAKPFYWLSGSIHSPETGSPEMLMELAYRLAVEDSAHIQAIRKNLIVLITPVVEVDGRDRMVDIYRYRKANPGKQSPGLVYWGKYVAHDNNRDAMGLALALSNVMMKTFLEWHPQVFHDLHESVPYLYTSTGTGPYNSWLDPIVVSEWQKLAYHEIEGMTRRGVPGVWTHGFYDGWAPNYMFYIANGHNAIGRFYETFGNGGADTREAQAPRLLRPRAPGTVPTRRCREVKWSIRNNVNMQQSALLLALKYVADNREEFVNNFALKSKRSVAKAKTEGPAAWIIPNDGKRPALAAQLARLLQRQGAEVHRLDRETEVKVAKPSPARGRPAAQPAGDPAPESKAEAAKPQAQKVAAGSYVVRMDQPYSRMVDMMLDTQYYSTADPRPYDDTGWTFGPLRNVVTLRVVDPSILDVPMTLIDGEVRAAGGVVGNGSAWFVLNANAEPALASLRFRLKDVKVFAAEEPFEVEGVKYQRRLVPDPILGKPRRPALAAQVGHRVARATRARRRQRDQGEAPPGLRAEDRLAPHLGQHAERRLVPPGPGRMRSALLIHLRPGYPRHARPEGEVRRDHLSPGHVESPDLDQRRPQAPARRRLGLRRPGPIQVHRADPEPGGRRRLGRYPRRPGFRRAGPPEDVRGARRRLRPGHRERQSACGARHGRARHDRRDAPASGQWVCPPRGVQDKRSPIAYGYDDTVALYFNQAPVFRVSLAGGGGFGRGGAGGPGGESAARPSGRGSATDSGHPTRSPAP